MPGNKEGLIEALMNIHTLSEPFRNALQEGLTEYRLSKNHILLEAGQVPDHLYFIQQGFAMTYSYFDGRKWVNSFRKAGQLLVSCPGFLQQLPASETFQLMLPSDIQFISHRVVQELFAEYPEMHTIYRMMLLQYHGQCWERVCDLQRLGAEARFTKLLREYPRIELLVAQEHIASYLGIRPQSLSRIKKRHRSRSKF
jgi:CRP/FNR family transcriptional regulator, anaerobic regulatory protein